MYLTVVSFKSERLINTCTCNFYWKGKIPRESFDYVNTLSLLVNVYTEQDRVRPILGDFMIFDISGTIFPFLVVPQRIILKRRADYSNFLPLLAVSYAKFS